MKSVIQEKTFVFSFEIINLYKYLTKTKNEYILSKQLLKSGTSIGANVEEALSAFSKKDFLAKIGIAYKESFETRYWLKLLDKSDYMNDMRLIEDLEEIIKILIKIILTTKNNLKNSYK